ncbi:MAG: plastocyanin/azurin family copper-binding protein [Gemmatimonadales bacterium]
MTRQDGWSRRRFLGATAGTVTGLGLIPRGLWLRGGDPTAEMGEKSDEGRASLPPRVVGLRTSGGEFRFDPVGLRIEPGTNMIWLNMGGFHTATAFHPDHGHLLGGEVPLRIPDGAEPWHSGMLGLTDGTQFEHTLAVEGVYDYFCQPHYGFGMVGRIIVDAGLSGALPVARPLSELPETAQKQMPAVETIMGPAGRSFEWAARLNGVLYLVANGMKAGPAAQRAVEEMEADETLRELVDAAGKQHVLAAATDRFLEGVVSVGDYENLVARSDAVKAELGALVRTA